MFVHSPQISPLTIMLHKYMYKIIFLSETSVGRLILLSNQLGQLGYNHKVLFPYISFIVPGFNSIIAFAKVLESTEYNKDHRFNHYVSIILKSIKLCKEHLLNMFNKLPSELQNSEDLCYSLRVIFNKLQGIALVMSNITFLLDTKIEGGTQ